MRIPDSSNKHTFPPSVTPQRCWSGSVGTVVEGGIVVVDEGDFVVDPVADVFTSATMLDELLIALECLNETPSGPFSPRREAMTGNNKHAN